MLRLNRPLQRLEDMPEMLRHSGVAGVQVVRRDGGDDRLMLLERSRGATGAQHGSILKSDALGFEGDEHPGSRLVVRDPPDALVEFRVELGVAERVVLANSIGHLGHHLPEIGDILVGRLGARGTGEQPLQRVSDLLDLERLAVGDESHPRAAIRLAGDQSLSIEHRKRCPDGGAPGSETNRQVSLDEAFIRLKPAAHNRLAEPAADLRTGVAGRNLRVSWG